MAKGDWVGYQGRYDEAKKFYEAARTVDPYRADGAARARLAELAEVVERRSDR